MKTSEFLQRMGVLGANARTQCVFCQKESKSVNHVLLHCPLIWRVWSRIIRWWDMWWVIPGSIEALLHWWAGASIKKKEVEVWKIVSLVLLWLIWRLRNDVLFNDAHPNFADLEDMVKTRVAFWAKSRLPGVNYTVHDFVHNLQQVRHCLR